VQEGKSEETGSDDGDEVRPSEAAPTGAQGSGTILRLSVVQLCLLVPRYRYCRI
jgi:hypothetical protein